MSALPIIHLGSDRPLPRALPLPLPLPSPTTLPTAVQSEDTAPVNALDNSDPQVKKKRSILKRMSILITWDHDGHPHKLHKNPPKQVTFASSHSHPDTDETIITPLPTDFGLPTPDPSPKADKKVKKKGSIISRIIPQAKVRPTPPSPTLTVPGLLPQELQASECQTDPWHHHNSYFPEYEPIHQPTTFIPGVPGMINHISYFPDYTPLYHHSHPINSYPGASGALAHALDTPEAEAAAHSQRVGHSVIIHYPDLPRFAEYQATSGGTKNATTGWQGTRWGVEGWTGFGWGGENLPDPAGLSFGAPMPKGEPLEKDKEGGGGGKKGKKGKGKEGDGEGDGDGEGGDGAEGGGAGDEEAKVESAEGGEGAGGGKKKKGKGKK